MILWLGEGSVQVDRGLYQHWKKRCTTLWRDVIARFHFHSSIIISFTSSLEINRCVLGYCDYVELRVRGATLDNIVLLIQQILFSPQT